MNLSIPTHNSSLKRTFFTLALLTLSFTFAQPSFAQGLDLNCVPITAIPPQCQRIADDIATREQSYRDRIALLREQAAEATSQAERRRLLARIRTLEQQRARDQNLIRLRNELRQCRAQFDTTPRRPVAPAELNASFTGNVVVNTTHPRAGGPFNQNLNLGIRFSRDRCTVTITSFPTITFQTPPTPVGRIDVSITQSGGGTGQFFPVSGELVLPISLHFHYDTIFAGDDNASMTITTGNSISPRGTFNLTGARLNTNNGTTVFGNLTLVGTTIFQDGFLGGQEGGFTITGQIGPPPPPPPRPLCPAGRKCCERIDGRCLICVPLRAQCP